MDPKRPARGILNNKIRQIHDVRFQGYRPTISPRSDINPALAAGLHAVFIPHDFTWALEHEVVDLPKGNERLIELSSIKELTQYF